MSWQEILGASLLGIIAIVYIAGFIDAVVRTNNHQKKSRNKNVRARF